MNLFNTHRRGNLTKSLMIFCWVLSSVTFWGCESQSSWTSSDYRAAGTSLYNQELYPSAAALYERYLNSPVIPREDMSKVMYQIGNIYLEKLNDPRKALEFYTQLKALFPEETFDNEVGKKMVMCLERIGRNVDAKHALHSLTQLDEMAPTPSADGGTVVAEIENRKITLREVELAVGKLPESPLEKNQLISNYVTQIMIADAARRKGLDGSEEYKKRLDFVSNQLLAEANLREELKLEPPSQNDIKYYFEANKVRWQSALDSGKTFETLLPEVQRAWAMEKQNEKYQVYVQKLLGSDRVKIHGTKGN